MLEQDLFIGRTDELSQIQNWLTDWNVPQTVWINGAGGIGKTRLLKEVYHRFKAQDASIRLLIPPIFDFDDRTLQVTENLEFEIARQSGKDSAKSYLRLLSDLRKMEAGDVSFATFENQKKNLHSEFLASINRVANEQRIVLLFDTTDAFDDSSKWGQVIDLLVDLVEGVTNIFIAVAGRKAKEHRASNDPASLLHGHLIDLAPLDPEERRQYIRQKQLELHIELEPAMEDRVLLLSKGKPILIDLATHWMAREYPMELLEERELDQKEFEKKLILQITQVRSQTDRLILLLSRAYPLDVEAISELLKLPKEEAAALVEEASSYVFIKTLPQEQITLHDEMRRMVSEFVWDEFDPSGERRKRDSRLFVSYLEKKIAKVEECIQNLYPEKKITQRTEDASAELKIFVEGESLKHLLWDLKEQRLYHLIYLSSFVEGIEIFIDLFDLATSAYRFQLRDTLLEIVNRYKDQLPDEMRYEVENRNVRYLLDNREYQSAQELARMILEWPNLAVEQQIDILILLGNIQIRLGDLKGAILSFKKAVQLSELEGSEAWLARSKNALGWAYRIQGDYEAAISNYLDAYLISYDLGDDRRTAWLLNNMGYVNAYRGDRKKALDNCWSALEIWEKLGFGRGIGATHSTLGEVYRRFDQLEDALFHYDTALEIFAEARDTEWMSIVKCGRSAVFLVMGELDRAFDDLNWAFDNGTENLKPRILNYKSRCYMQQSDWNAAKTCLEKSREISFQTGDKQYNLRSFADLIDIAWEAGDFSKWSDFQPQLEEICNQMSGEEVARLRGSSLRKIGDLAMCNGNYDTGLASYQEGLPLIAKYEVHSPYLLREQLKITGKRIYMKCSTANVNELGQALEEFWKERKELRMEYPETLLIFNRWKQRK